MGRRESFQGVVLRGFRTGEASRAIDILTHEGSVVHCVARGAAKSKKRFIGCLEPFTSGRFQLHHGRGRPTIEAVDDVKSRFGIAKSVKGMAAASCACEWMLKTAGLHDEESSQLVFLVQFLDLVEASDENVAALLFGFELGLMALAGFLPDINHCTNCGEIFDSRDEVSLSQLDGTFIHHEHGVGKSIEQDVRNLLSLLCSKNLSFCRRVKMGRRQKIGVAELIGDLMSYHVGFVVKSRGFALQVV